MAAQRTTEVEIGVVEAERFLLRLVLRGDSSFSIGPTDDATLTLDALEGEPTRRLLSFEEVRPTVHFDENSRLEVELDGERLRGAELLDRGIASMSGGGARLALSDGVRFVYLVGPVQILVKVRARVDVSTWNLQHDDPRVCGGCSTELLWPPGLSPGSLVSCASCGDLNRCAAEDSQAQDQEQPALEIARKHDALPRESTPAKSVEPMQDVPGIKPPAEAFDDEEEATEIEGASTAVAPEIAALDSIIDDDDAPTEPGREFPKAPPGPASLPPRPGEASLARSGEAPGLDRPTGPEHPEPSYVPEMKSRFGRESDGDDFFTPRRPRRQRQRRKPNYLGWALVSLGLVSGLAGGVLLVLANLT